MATTTIRGPKEYSEDGQRYRIVAQGELFYIRGNRFPYFSLTGTIDRWESVRWRDDRGGCIHEEVLKHWPELAPLAALHLSNIYGAPSHDGGNAFYFLEGALPDLGYPYHYGNSQGHHGGTYRYPTSEECLEAFARYVRVPQEEAKSIHADILATLGPPQEDPGVAPYTKADRARATKRLDKILDTMRPRWLVEAEAVIETFGLKVTGPWPRKG